MPASGRRICLRFHLLSFDAPLVAVLWQAFFAKRLHVDIRWPAFVALAISVWVIYVADRMLDGLKADGITGSRRHDFYRRYWWNVLRATAAALIVLAVSCHFLNSMVIRNGIILAGIVSIYFVLVHVAPQRFQRWWPKELAVGILFAVGTSLATWTKLGTSRKILIVPAALFAMLCWLNCVAIEFWEWKRIRGMAAPPHPWTVWMGARLPKVALLVAAVSTSLLAVDGLALLSGASILSAIGFLWLHRQSDRLPTDTLRVLADVSLLTPALLLGFH
jgi:hypothetical protein